MFNLNNWRIDDPEPSLLLANITPIARRAWSLLARNKTNSAIQIGFMNLVGAIDMIDGLEYHHTSFMRIIQLLSEIPAFSDTSYMLRAQLGHEAVAYLNRIGQFYYFGVSEFVRQRVADPESIILTIIKFKILRDKHSAHRSLDQPRKEDTLHRQHTHAWALSSIGGSMFSPKASMMNAKEPLDPLDMQRKWLDYYFCLQMIDVPPSDALDFSVEREHPLIVGEAFQLLEQLVSMP